MVQLLKCCCLSNLENSCHVNNLWEIAPNKNLSSRNKCSLSSELQSVALYTSTQVQGTEEKVVLMTKFILMKLFHDSPLSVSIQVCFYEKNKKLKIKRIYDLKIRHQIEINIAASHLLIKNNYLFHNFMYYMKSRL